MRTEKDIVKYVNEYLYNENASDLLIDFSKILLETLSNLGGGYNKSQLRQISAILDATIYEIVKIEETLY